MTTDAQIAANRRNARRSTGPKTAEGKKRSRMNRWKHGLTARLICMDHEQLEEFEEYRYHMRVSMQLSTDLEEELAERIIVASWKRRRLEAMEKHVMHFFTTDDFRVAEFDVLLRYRGSIERELHKCIADLDRMQKNRNRRLQILAEERAVDASNHDYRMATPFNLKRVASLVMGEYMRAIHANLQPPPAPAGRKERPKATTRSAHDETNPISPETPATTGAAAVEEAAPTTRCEPELAVA
ncbi:MAG: hypothetical protein AB7S36_15815 [Planctomycetota bacterium]